MKLRDFKALLESNREKQFLLQLPSRDTVPMSFHITEVGYVDKTFIDCGGKVHSQQTCQLQAWVGDDEDHRLNAGKMADILRLAQKIVPDNDVDLEVEYEDTAISQYTVSESEVTDTSVTLLLASKHTDCLAKSICCSPTSTESSCCGPTDSC